MGFGLEDTLNRMDGGAFAEDGSVHCASVDILAEWDI